MRKTFVLLGHPVGHSVSPAIHQEAYAEFGLDAGYRTVDCPDRAAVEAQRDALRRGDIHGANITVPHKRLALELADEIDPSAQATGAANVWVRGASGRIVAHNTDAPALAERLESGLRAARARHPGLAGAVSSCLILGNGGAALAAVVGSRQAGIGRLFVSARKWRGARELWPSAAEFEVLGATLLPWPARLADGSDEVNTAFDEAACQSDVIVQATSSGMLGVANGETVVEILPWPKLRRDAFLYDVVYNPEQTPFLTEACRSGLYCEGGLSMLVGQAALAIRLWLDVDPDRERLLSAAQRALFGADS